MALDDVARELSHLRTEMAGMRSDLAGVKTEVVSVKADLAGVRSDLGDVKSDLAGVKSDVTDVKADFTVVRSEATSVKSELFAMRTEMAEGFRRVDDQLNAAKVRDEELHGLMKFGLETREALRESIEDRFDRTERKHDEQIQLLNEVVKTIPRR